jgi:hypothetical protein
MVAIAGQFRDRKRKDVRIVRKSTFIPGLAILITDSNVADV